MERVTNVSCRMRSVSVYDPRIRDRLRCPACGRIDWHGDGIAVVESAEGVVHVEGVDVGRRPQVAAWTCRTCGHIPELADSRSRLLARAVIASRYSELA